MPSWPIHLALANKLKNKYNLTDDFILGSIMPDATNGFIIKDISHVIAHALTHYNFETPGKPPKNSISKFLEIYHGKLANPIIYGSYIHLLTDNFYNEYFYNTHIIDNKTAILHDGTKSDTITPWKLKQEEFRKFGDYLIYTHQLGDRIKRTDKTLEYINELTYPIDQQDLKLVFDKVNSLVDKDVKKAPNYKMFSQVELEKLFDDCYNYLENIIEGKEE